MNTENTKQGFELPDDDLMTATGGTGGTAGGDYRTQAGGENRTIQVRDGAAIAACPRCGTRGSVFAKNTSTSATTVSTTVNFKECKCYQCETELGTIESTILK